MKTQIKAEIVAHSINEQGDELISVMATFPRIILSEINTHRMLSKNTSSSRAIPFAKMVETIKNDPFIPIAFQKSHSGMQGTEYLTGLDYDQAKFEWLEAKDRAIEQAQQLDKIGTTKQLCNRLLEPFMWTTMLITGPKSGWDNFFNLRCGLYSIHGCEEEEDQILDFKSKKEVISYYQNKGYSMNKCYIGENPYTNEERFQGTIDEMTELEWLKINKGQAEIHMMALAECIWDALNKSTPRQLKAGEWHIPFADKMDIPSEEYIKITGKVVLKSEDLTKIKVKSSVAMAARTSYTVVGKEKEVNYEAMIELHDKLLAQDPPHSSPLEHCARCMSNEEYDAFYKGQLENKEFTFVDHKANYLIGSGNQAEHGWCNNFKGFIPYRYMVDNGKVD